jgi:hypothetical protein
MGNCGVEWNDSFHLREPPKGWKNLTTGDTEEHGDVKIPTSRAKGAREMGRPVHMTSNKFLVVKRGWGVRTLSRKTLGARWKFASERQ